MQRSDYGPAFEVFVDRFYDSPRAIAPNSVQYIVDLGANVGMSILFWLHNYPKAHIEAFEPHPTHVARLRTNLALNEAEGRVTLHPTAAGVRPGRMALTDEGMSSSVVALDAVRNAIPVDVEDAYETLLAREIDILKIDIEGGEFPILEDARFPQIAARALAMEWHRREDGRDGDRCTAILSAAGYEVVPLFDLTDHGMVWAYKWP